MNKEPEHDGISRRRLLKVSAVAGGAVWAAPTVTSLGTRALAQDGSPVAGCGRMTGGGRILNDTATYGFELHCSPDSLPNNLEVNFPTADGEVAFHLDALTGVVCSDNGDPTPPAADFNTLTATGTGHTTGACTGAATISFELVDNGEPSADDTVDFTITYACGSFSTGGAVQGGNIQAHQTSGRVVCEPAD